MAQTIYEQIGGEEGIRRLTRRFYTLMDELPVAAACRAVHGPSLAGAEQKLFDYLTGWLGGPPLYTDKHGHPMLRARHLPFAIGEAEIEGWLTCFAYAWAEVAADLPARDLVMRKVVELAHHMRNKDVEPVQKVTSLL